MKIRINDLARELEVKSKAILDVLEDLGVDGKKSHSSSIEDDEAEKIRKHFTAKSGPASARDKSASPEIKPKIDLSKISKPGDVARLLREREEQQHRPPTAPPRPPVTAAAPPAVIPPKAAPSVAVPPVQEKPAVIAPKPVITPERTAVVTPPAPKPAAPPVAEKPVAPPAVIVTPPTQHPPAVVTAPHVVPKPPATPVVSSTPAAPQAEQPPMAAKPAPNQPIVQQRRPHLEAMSHAHAIDFCQHRARQIRLKIQCQQ